jgi:molybdenum cofactor biosynthesis enzyme
MTIYSPLANLTFFGAVGTVGILAVSTNWELIKLCELPLSEFEHHFIFDSGFELDTSGVL